MQRIAFYAEEGKSFDPDGKYLCNSCYYRERMDWGDTPACYIVEGKISMEDGSCDRYIHGTPDAEWNPLPMLHKYSQAQAGYAERPKEKGFGCSRCEYGAKAKKPDSKGRESWCNMFGVHVRPEACCSSHDGKDMLVPPKNMAAAVETSHEAEKAGALWNGIRLTGFTGPEEEGLRAMLSRIPPELITNVAEIKSAKELNAKHGQYIPKEKVMLFNPKNFALRQRFKGHINHAELTIVHEMGHAIYATLTPEEKVQWFDIFDWRKGNGAGHAPPYVERRPGWESGTSKWTHKYGIQFPRYYSEKNPNECFSDCFAFYLLGMQSQMSFEIKDFFDQFIKDHVKNYPKALVASEEMV